MTWEEARRIVRTALEPDWQGERLAIAETGYQDTRWYLVPYGVETQLLDPATLTWSPGEPTPMLGDPLALVDRQTGELEWWGTCLADVLDRVAAMEPVGPIYPRG